MGEVQTGQGDKEERMTMKTIMVWVGRVFQGAQVLRLGPQLVDAVLENDWIRKVETS